jgi:hypothetical protein
MRCGNRAGIYLVSSNPNMYDVQVVPSAWYTFKTAYMCIPTCPDVQVMNRPKNQFSIYVGVPGLSWTSTSALRSVQPLQPIAKNTLSDEVYPRQCPCRRAFDLGNVLGTRRTRRRSDESKGTQGFTQVQPPRKVKGLRPACLTSY